MVKDNMQYLKKQLKKRNINIVSTSEDTNFVY